MIDYHLVGNNLRLASREGREGSCAEKEGEEEEGLKEEEEQPKPPPAISR